MYTRPEEWCPNHYNSGVFLPQPYSSFCGDVSHPTITIFSPANSLVFSSSVNTISLAMTWLNTCRIPMLFYTAFIDLSMILQ